jgi:uncharacterized protein
VTPADFTVPFSFGIVSSIHCTQMCGPIVLGYSMASRGNPLSHLLYNGGRIVTYSVLGAAAGAAGGAVDLTGRLIGLQRPAMIAAGVLMIIAAVFMSGLVPRSGLVTIDRFGVSRRVSSAVSRLMMSAAPASKFSLGMLMGFLPCGLLYAALLRAVSTGDPLTGAVTMAAFGAGTALALLGIGVFSVAIGARLGRWAPTLATVSVLVMGALLVWRGMMAMPHHPQPSCHGHS